jgi:hypothetical protein
MRSYLIVANRTLTGPHLVAEALTRAAAGPCRFHVCVPSTPAGAAYATWTEGRAHAIAAQRLEHVLDSLREAGIEATGNIGDESPVLAVGDALRHQPFDEIIVSTLPPGLSRWLKLDLPHRLERMYHLPVTHVIAVPEPARPG